jgi:hypothetical protein
MMEGSWVPDDMCRKVTLKAIACVTQLDGLVVLDVNDKIAARDVHMFGAKLKRTRNL